MKRINASQTLEIGFDRRSYLADADWAMTLEPTGVLCVNRKSAAVHFVPLSSVSTMELA